MRMKIQTTRASAFAVAHALRESRVFYVDAREAQCATLQHKASAEELARALNLFDADREAFLRLAGAL